MSSSFTEEELAEIRDTAKTNLLTALAAGPSYRAGPREQQVENNDYIKELRETIDFCEKELKRLPSEEDTIWRQE